MRKRTLIRKHNSTEFELDLAPLLSVMVKLVPVLLLSSAFVQVMVIETELPQAVQQAIQNTDLQKSVIVKMKVEADRSTVIEIAKNNQIEQVRVPASSGQINYSKVHENLVSIKNTNPQIFRLELEPDSKVSYNEIVKLMDEARIKRDKSKGFQIIDQSTGKSSETFYMFPDVVFSNIFSG